FSQPVPISLNRLILDHDQIVICGPVFPHEVVGFSGGSKYLFPGIAGADIINFTHWLGALLTSYAIIGTRDTAVRAVIESAAKLVPTPVMQCCFVNRHDDLFGLYISDSTAAWRAAAAHSAQLHITYLSKPVTQVLSILPPRYDDLWTGAKGMYKVEPIIADGGEVVIYAP